MKKIYTYLLILATAVLTLFSCQEIEEYQPGEPELKDCFGVYFPSQELTSKTYIIEPSVETNVVLKASRKVTEGEITVPVVITESAEGVFDVQEIKFEDGQTETEFKVSFDKAEIGKEYTLSLSIEDPKYASVYSQQASACDFKVKRESWKNLGTGYLIDNIMFSDPEAGIYDYKYEVKIEQNPQKPEIFRISNLPYNEQNLKEWGYEIKAGPDASMTIKLLKKGDVIMPGTPVETKITQENLILYETFFTGWYWSDRKSEVAYAHPVLFKLSESEFVHNKVIAKQENGLPIAIQIAPLVLLADTGSGLPMHTEDGGVTIIFPGCELTDYSLSLDAGVAQEGVITVYFSRGKDVANVKYAAYEGVLNKAQLDKKVEAILGGKEEQVKELGAENNAAQLSFEKTGTYTLVAISYDKEGNAQEVETINFDYLAAGETHPVILNSGLIISDKYASVGATAENSVEAWAYGKDIKKACVGLYRLSDLVSDQAGVIEDLLENQELSAEDLALLNGEGWSAVIKDLFKGTEYALVIYASNGYEENLFVETAKTEGVGDPTQFDYTLDNLFLPEDPTTYLGNNWVFYSRGEDGRRVPLCDGVSISAGKVIEGQQTLTLKNLWKPVLAAQGMEIQDDEIGLLLYPNNILFTLPSAFGKLDFPGLGELYLRDGAVCGDQQTISTSAMAMIGGITEFEDVLFLPSTPLTDLEKDHGGIAAYGILAYEDAEYKKLVGSLITTDEILLINPAHLEESSLSAERLEAIAETKLMLKDIQKEYQKHYNVHESTEAQINAAIQRVNMNKTLSKGRIMKIGTMPENASVGFEAKAMIVSKPVKNLNSLENNKVSLVIK